MCSDEYLINYANKDILSLECEECNEYSDLNIKHINMNVDHRETQ